MADAIEAGKGPDQSALNRRRFFLASPGTHRGFIRSPDTGSVDVIWNTKMQTWISAVILAIGLALMAFMIITESEPGALPLALVLIGGIWLFVARRRSSKRQLSR